MPFELSWETPKDAAYSWNRAGHEPYPTLYQDAIRSFFAAMHRCYERTGSVIAREYILRIIDGWAYARGPTGDEKRAAELHRRHQQHASTFIERETTYYTEELRPEVVALVERLRRHPRVTAPFEDLVAHLTECIEAHALVMGDLHWRMVLADPPFDWKTTFRDLTGGTVAEAHVLLGGTANEMTKMVHRMRALARLGSGERFDSAFKRFLKRYGLRSGQGWGSRVTIDGATWNMRPDIPLGMIATYAHSDIDAAERREKAAAGERRALLARVRRSLRSDPGRLKLLDAAYRRAKRNALMMEDHNHWMDQCSAGVLREAAHVVGMRLVRDEKLDDPYDVVHISLDELRTLARGEPVGDLRALTAERGGVHSERVTYDPPRTIGAGPAEPGLNLEDEGEGFDGSVLHGVAASAGRYTGRARIIAQDVVLPAVADGEILVAKDAGPNWTPVFPVLGALVLDRGAVWQHAAVMSREFGIPAVMGTKEATSLISDGQTITVDGDAGVVEL